MFQALAFQSAAGFVEHRLPLGCPVPALLEHRLNSDGKRRTWLFVPFPPYPTAAAHEAPCKQSNTTLTPQGWRQEGKIFVSEAKNTKMQTIIFAIIYLNSKEILMFRKLKWHSHRESSGYVSLQTSLVQLIPQSAIMLVYYSPIDPSLHYSLAKISSEVSSDRFIFWASDRNVVLCFSFTYTT